MGVMRVVRMQQLFRLGAGAAIALALAAAAGCGRGKPAAATEVARAPAGPLVVTRGVLEDRMVLTGELEAIVSDNMVVPRTPAWLLSVRWLAEDGATVKKGDRVVEFDSSTFAGTLEDKRLAVVRTGSELYSEEARAAGAEADKVMEVDRKRAELYKAEVEASVPADLYPKRMYQEKQLTLSQKKDALAKAEDDLRAHRRASRLEKTVKSVALSRAERELTDLNERLEELVLRAPRDGLVQLGINRREPTQRKFLVGDQAFPGFVIASMPDLTAMQVRARLSDVDDGAVREGMRAACVLDAFPDKTWKCGVQQVSPVARAEGREATRRFFDVVVKLEESAPSFMRPGMSVRIEVVRRRAEDALLVPRVAVRAVPGKAEVRTSGGQAQTVDIEWCTELVCVVRGGVLEGTRLVAQGPAGQGPS
jgi:multidrug efflux pump subunit AcrA (membrane-fusion protein)